MSVRDLVVVVDTKFCKDKDLRRVTFRRNQRKMTLRENEAKGNEKEERKSKRIKGEPRAPNCLIRVSDPLGAEGICLDPLCNAGSAI